MSASDVDLLLIGKTGSGKSATGNMILGRKCFKSNPSLTSVTKETQFDYCEYGDRVIKVVDCPGIGDTDFSSENALTLVIDSMQCSIAANTKGYHSFLLVIRFGCRFTEEDKQMINLLKKMFGADFVANYCILIMTGGDNYNPEETEAVSFFDWCLAQEGTFRFLLQECNNRIVLFDNRTKDPIKIKQQIDELLNHVDHIKSLHQRYTDKHFKLAETERNKIVLESGSPVIHEDTIKETSLILQQLGSVRLEDPSKEIFVIRRLKYRAADLHTSLRILDKGTGCLKDMTRNSKNILACVDHQMESMENAIKIQALREKNKRKLEKLKEQRQKEMKEEHIKEIENKCQKLEKEEENLKAKITEMEEKLETAKELVQDEFIQAKNKKTWKIIHSVASKIFKFAMPYARSLLESLKD